MSKDEIKLAFNPSGQRGNFPRGTLLLDAARSLGVDIDSVCGGRGICCKCQIKCVEGTFLKHQIKSSNSHLSDSCLLYTSPSPRDVSTSRMPSSA